MSSICTICQGTFATDEEYIAHTCVDGKTPTEPEHLGPEFMAISGKAVVRGEEREKLEDQGKSPEEAQRLTFEKFKDDKIIV
jgi:hypothetical protein